MRFTSRSNGLGALLIAMLLVVLASPGWAQQGTIAGTVKSQTDSTPIPGASVLLVNTNRIAVTSRAGRFTFTAVPPGAYDLRVIAVGFASQLKRFTVEPNGTSTIDFALARAVISLDEIVVNPATGEARARESGNAVTNINMPKALEDQTVANLGDALSGRAAGVQVLQSSGEVGTSTRIRIRGQSSISLSNEPVYYIDGVRVESSDNSLSTNLGGQTTSRIDDINPDDIANVEIVKGPSASTLYGTQAANGVVRITTKHGVAGRARWRIFGEGGMLNDENTYPTNYFSWGHSATSAARHCTLFQSAAGSCTIDSLTSFNVLMDPKQTFIGTGYRGLAGLQVEGGSDQVQYYVSGEHSDDIGTYRLSNLEYNRLTIASGGVAPDYSVFRPNELKSTSLRSNIHAQPLTALDFSANLGIVNSRARFPQNDNNVTGVLPSGLFGNGIPGSSGNWGFFLPGDIFQILTQQDITRMTGSLSTTWRPTTFFTGRANVGVDYTGRTDIQLQKRGEGTNFSNYRQGRRSDNRFQIYHYTADVGGTASFTLTPTITSKTSVGFQYLKDNLFGVLANGQNLPPGGQAITGAAIRTASEQTVVTVTLGTYAEQTFGWRDRVFLTGGVRNDRNSAFGSKVRSVVYPKLQGSWVISDESFYPHNLPVSNLKLRFAYGASGQQPGTIDALLYYSAATATVFSGTGTGSAADQPGVDPTAFGNSSLKPERSTELETGFDAGLFHDAARLEVTYYDKKTRDALVNRPLPPSNGIATQRYENIGSVRNRGLEVLLSVTKDITPSIGVDAALNVARNVNKLLSLSGGIPPIISGNDQRQVVGYPLFGFWDRPIKSYNDANGNGIIEPSEVVVGDTAEFLGSSYPKTSISLNAGLTLFHNRIRIGGQFDYRGDWKAYNLTERFRCVSIGDNCAAVNVPGSPLDQQARAVAASNSAFGFTQAGYIENAAFLKLREANITYYAPESWARAVRATSMQISLTGRNLLKWTNYTGIDPELNQLGQNGGDLQRDFLTAPPVRTLAVRVSLGF